jgi:dipeptidyl aminopeptidase/acylaminoacyl peptidase
MKYTLCLIFIIPLILWACQSSRSDIPTQSVPSPLSETESVIIIQSPSFTPSPTTIFTTTPPQTPVPAASPTVSASLSSLRVVYSDGKNVWLWQNSVVTPLTTIEGYTDVKLSDDGELVAFMRDRLLWVIHSDGTGEQLLVSTERLETIEPATSDSKLLVFQFDWVLNTHNLLFNTTFSGYGVSHRDDLHMVDADTREWKTLRDAGDGGKFLISPRGSHVVMVTPHEISLIDIDGTNDRSLLKYSQIDTGSEYFYYADPIWSLDSRSLVVDIPPRDYKDNPTAAPTVIWHLFVDSRLPVQISQFPAQDRYLFSPDISKLAYNELINDVLETHIANIDGSEDLIYQPGINMSFQAWSPDSEHFILITRNSRQYFLGRIGEEPMPLTEQDSQDFLWIDEIYFLYKNIHNGFCELRLGTIGKPSVLLATFAMDPVSSYCFSPYDFVQ